MIEALSPFVLFGLGGFAALWLLLALWAVARGVAMQRRAAFVGGQINRLTDLVEASPHLPVVIRGDWRVEASARLGSWLGLDRTPGSFDEWAGVSNGLDEAQHQQLRQAILGAQRGAKSFTLTLQPQGGARQIVVRGAPAPQGVGGSGRCCCG